MTEGIYQTGKIRTGYDPYTAEYYYYDTKFRDTLDREQAVGFITKSNGVTLHYLRFATKLVDPNQSNRIAGNFIKVDEEIFGMYRGYIEKGNYAGYVEANSLISLRGYN